MCGVVSFALLGGLIAAVGSLSAAAEKGKKETPPALAFKMKSLDAKQVEEELAGK